MRPIIASLFASLALPVFADDPWGKVDIEAAKPLHDKACSACHIRMYGGDGSKMYARNTSVLSDKLELLQRVGACNSRINAGWFPEEEGNVAAWLNKTYYHFEK